MEGKERNIESTWKKEKERQKELDRDFENAEYWKGRGRNTINMKFEKMEGIR